MAEQQFDLVVVGGGPGGYVAAIRAAQLKMNVALVEREHLGGICLNWGCIPTKSLLKNAEVYQTIKHHAGDFGLKVEGLTYEWDKVIGRSRKVADRLAGGIEMLFKKNKVDYLRGEAEIPQAGTVVVTGNDGKKTEHTAAKILIATGVVSREMPGFPYNGKSVIGSRQAMVLEKQPKEIIIIGAGAIGVEFAYFYNAFGSKVTLVEMLPQILPVEDEEVAKTLHRSFEKQGIAIHTATKCESFQVGKNSVKLNLVKDGQGTAIEAETVLSAIGVVANLEGVFGKSVSVELDRNYVKVGDDYQSSVKGIYAAGDIIGPPWLAHVATFEAVSAVNGMFGHGKAKRVKNFPGCTYCQPQIASTGLTEQAAKEKKLDYRVGKFPFTASGKAVASAESEGFVKVISDAKTGEILGAHIIGAEATELIAEYGLAVELEATIEDIHQTIHAHPTLSEAVMEAAAATTGEAIHI